MSEYRKPVNVKNDMGGGTAGCFDKRMSEIFQLLPYIPGQLEQFLDVGFGRGQISEYLVKQGKHVTAIGLELESYGIMLEKYKKDGIQLVEADAEKMPFESETFDCVIASHVLEHVHNMGLVLSEMRRVLKDEGWLVIFIPRFTNCVCAGHINTGWNLGQLMYVLLLNKFNIRQGKFIEFGYSLCAMVKKEEFDLPPLRGDRGDIHILNEAHLFPAEIEMKNGLADGFEGNIKAVNWSDAEELIAKSIYPAGKLRIILALKKIMVRLIGARQTRMIGELLVSGNQVNPDKFIY